MLRRLVQGLGTLRNKTKTFSFAKVIVEEGEDFIDLKDESLKREKLLQDMLRLPQIVDLNKTTSFSGSLTICPTPIGNLRDLTLRNYRALMEADIIVCEDTHHTGKMLRLLLEKGIDAEMNEACHIESESDQFENDFQKDDEFFEEFEKRELNRHKNMKSYKKLKDKMKDQKVIDDIHDFKKKGALLLSKDNNLSFLGSSQKEEDSLTIHNSHTKRKSMKNLFQPESEFFDGLDSDSSKAFGSYGLDSELIQFTREKVMESKVRHKRGILISCNRFNEKEKLAEIMKLLKVGFKVTLVSDAGSPVLSDPGQILIDQTMKQGILIDSLPGANAITTSLAASGFPGNDFMFIGYLSKERSHKELQLRRAKHLAITSIMFENKNRILTTLLMIERIFGSNQFVYVGIELTKMFQNQLRGTIKEVVEKLNKDPNFNNPAVKGEITVVIAPFNEQFNETVKQLEVETIKRSMGQSLIGKH